ncbi:Uncharacterised protein [Mycobacteroides abscessus subsp. abscessus]|nr:Uncharacterised protein [Mycobacteroides abscessus subsp. abscessus]SKY23265.1 Uncharacterised protein [Mycobacteroides abscessus subsp. abscessus]
MRCLRVLAMALIVTACASPSNGVKIVTNGETPTAFSPPTTNVVAYSGYVCAQNLLGLRFNVHYG